MNKILETNSSFFVSPINLGASGLDEIEQNIKIIILTLAYSVPLDRSFAGKGKYIDSPNPLNTARHIAELTEALEKYEPRIKVNSIDFKPYPTEAIEGIVYPVIKYTIKEGVQL